MSTDPARPVALTAFDARTAQAVVAVLTRHGIPAAGRPAGRTPDEDEVEVVVPADVRDEALRLLGERMEEVREAVAEADARGGGRAASGRSGGGPHPRDQAPPPDPDDVHAGPPLVMERFRNLSWVTVVLLVPLLAVTIAGPLAGDLRRVGAVALMVVVGIVLWRRRRR